MPPPRPSPRRALCAALCAALLSVGTPAQGAGEEGVDDTVGRWLSSPQILEPPTVSRLPSVILLHGLGGSPYDLKPLAERLVESGFRVVVPVLPGETSLHAGSEREDLTDDEMIGWIGALVEEEAARRGRDPFLVGFSMGGTLATIEAARGTVSRLVLVSPYYSLPWGNSFLEGASRPLAPVLPRVQKPWKGKVNDPDGYERYEPGSSTLSFRAFHRLQDLARRATAILAASPALPPTLVLASPDDEVASFEVTEELFRDRPGTVFLTFPGNNHILFYDYGASRAVEAVRDFLLRGEEAP